MNHKVTDKITLYYEDRMKVMSRLPDKSINLAILDPEYGLNAPNMKMGEHDGYRSSATKGRLNKGGGILINRTANKSDIDWDNQPPPKEFFDEVFRVSKDQIIFGGNYFELPPTRGIGFWDKLQPWDNFSQFELIWTSFDCPAFKIECGSRGGNNLEQKFHPTQKPPYIYKFLLSKFAKNGFKILDTGFGSGSIAIACYDLGFELIACEDKEYYYYPAINRITKHIMYNPHLFSPEELRTGSLF